MNINAFVGKGNVCKNCIDLDFWLDLVGFCQSWGFLSSGGAVHGHKVCVLGESWAGDWIKNA